MTRYQEKGGFIQAWGELGAKDNYRLIVDCLLNIPLLYWASEETGDPVVGKTRQGYSDDSSWARGQSWLIYGIALNYAFRPKESDIAVYEAVTNDYLNRLPKDFISYWDLIFDDESQQSRDSSAAAIVVCGMNLMNQFLPETFDKKIVYTSAQHSMQESLIDHYTEQLGSGTTAFSSFNTD